MRRAQKPLLTPEGKHTFRMTGENGNGELVVFELDSGRVLRENGIMA
jgi:hypothetical protein